MGFPALVDPVELVWSGVGVVACAVVLVGAGVAGAVVPLDVASVCAGWETGTVGWAAAGPAGWWLVSAGCVVVGCGVVGCVVVGCAVDCVGAAAGAGVGVLETDEAPAAGAASLVEAALADCASLVGVEAV